MTNLKRAKAENSFAKSYRHSSVISNVGICAIAFASLVSGCTSRPTSELDIGSIKVPEFPERPEKATARLKKVQKYEVELGEQGGIYKTPGVGGKLWVYLPSGKHAEGTLPCILSPANRTMDYSQTQGAELNEFNEQFYLEFAQKGFAVVAYELDGGRHNPLNKASFGPAYAAFKASGAGVINGRNALEYAVQRLPEVSAEKIFVLGFDSSSSEALLFASHESRVAGVAAIEPIVDVPNSVKAYQFEEESPHSPGLKEFLQQKSPHAHIKALKCPTFLFHNPDKGSGPAPGDVEGFATRLKQQGTDVTLEVIHDGPGTARTEGLQSALAWLRKQAV